MIKTYRYTECGLDNVDLVNGFELTDGRLRIENIEGLHRAIGQWLVSTRRNLSGREIRFLRHELEMSQATLANLLGVTEQTVLRWERPEESEATQNSAAEKTLRLLYLERALGDSRVSEVLEQIADLEDKISQLVEFSFSEEHEWHENIAA